jgi:hypothetical protein
VQLWVQLHGRDPGVAEELAVYGKAAVVLYHLDLELARPLLMQGYADNPRGGNPRDPVLVFRSLLLSILLGVPGINEWVDKLKGSRVLRMLTGISDVRDTGPGVGTHYDWMHRLNDGPIRRPCRHDKRPSDDERQRSRTPKPPKPSTKPRGKESRSQRKRRERERAKKSGVTERLVSALKGSQMMPNPNDLALRLALILLEVGAKPSARRGLLGDVQKLTLGGDASAVHTGGSRHGKRTCRCPKQSRCDCDRVYSDPDADVGYDSHRDLYYYGHKVTEFVVSTKGGHDLPLALRMDPASTSEFVTALTGFESLRKLLRDHSEWQLEAMTYDAGLDGLEVYRFLLHHDVTPFIPLSRKAPAVHPNHSAVSLSDRGVPLCPAGKEMKLIGRSGKNNQVFGCPAKASKTVRCPHATDQRPDYRCQPLTRTGPTVTINSNKNPRLCPPVPRNHPRHNQQMNLRSGCERSFSVKKGPFKLQQARHRRRSFWLIRAHLMAVLQHALAWVADEDATGFVDRLLGRSSDRAAAA